ncbi:MAG: 30S ribosomal protein S2 [Candidatus Vogelbacteria bacterium]|nr:30S ribosomal protein S2 [Candidatus Vogelbacteria bacterium]
MQTEKVDEKLVDDLFKVGAHFGYSKTRRHPSLKPYIFGSKNRMDIIDLDKTVGLLARALAFVEQISREGKQIVFVGNKKEAQKYIIDAATKLDMPYVANRWIGGTLTNFPEIRKRQARLEDLMNKKENGGLDVYTKKERGVLDKEMADLTKRFWGIMKMKRLPGAILVIDSNKEDIAVLEAKKAHIPIISLSGSDCDISKIDYPVVANDAASLSIEFFLNKVVDAYRGAKVINSPVSIDLTAPIK